MIVFSSWQCYTRRRPKIPWPEARAKGEKVHCCQSIALAMGFKVTFSPVSCVCAVWSCWKRTVRSSSPPPAQPPTNGCVPSATASHLWASPVDDDWRLDNGLLALRRNKNGQRQTTRFSRWIFAHFFFFSLVNFRGGESSFLFLFQDCTREAENKQVNRLMNNNEATRTDTVPTKATPAKVPLLMANQCKSKGIDQEIRPTCGPALPIYFCHRFSLCFVSCSSPSISRQRIIFLTSGGCTGATRLFSGLFQRQIGHFGEGGRFDALPVEFIQSFTSLDG